MTNNTRDRIIEVVVFGILPLALFCGVVILIHSLDAGEKVVICHELKINANTCEAVSLETLRQKYVGHVRKER